MTLSSRETALPNLGAKAVIFAARSLRIAPQTRRFTYEWWRKDSWSGVTSTRDLGSMRSWRLILPKFRFKFTCILVIFRGVSSERQLLQSNETEADALTVSTNTPCQWETLQSHGHRGHNLSLHGSFSRYSGLQYNQSRLIVSCCAIILWKVCTGYHHLHCHYYRFCCRCRRRRRRRCRRRHHHHVFLRHSCDCTSRSWINVTRGMRCGLVHWSPRLSRRSASSASHSCTIYFASYVWFAQAPSLDFRCSNHRLWTVLDSRGRLASRIGGADDIGSERIKRRRWWHRHWRITIRFAPL